MKSTNRRWVDYGNPCATPNDFLLVYVKVVEDDISVTFGEQSFIDPPLNAAILRIVLTSFLSL